jgi:hypothetical protein
MSFALLFALMMILWLLFSIMGRWTWPNQPYGPIVNGLFIWILFALLGWRVFGPLLHP